MLQIVAQPSLVVIELGPAQLSLFQNLELYFDQPSSHHGVKARNRSTFNLRALL